MLKAEPAHSAPQRCPAAPGSERPARNRTGRGTDTGKGCQGPISPLRAALGTHGLEGFAQLSQVAKKACMSDARENVCTHRQRETGRAAEVPESPWKGSPVWAEVSHHRGCLVLGLEAQGPTV